RAGGGAAHADRHREPRAGGGRRSRGRRRRSPRRHRPLGQVRQVSDMIAFLRFEITRTLRNARFLVMLIAFPVALYLIYGTQKGVAQNLTIGTLFLVAMAVYAGLG